MPSYNTDSKYSYDMGSVYKTCAYSGCSETVDTHEFSGDFHNTCSDCKTVYHSKTCEGYKGYCKDCRPR